MDFTLLFQWAFLVPLLTVLSFVIVGLFGRWMPRFEHGGWVAVGFAGAAMVLGVLIGIGEMLSPGQYTDTQYVWLSVPANTLGTFPHGFELIAGTLIDPLSALMLIVVTVVGFLVLLYSIEYMHHDRGLPRYYAELSLFLAAMNGMVLADNLLEFFVFWELVGVCSYFLIGFYYEKPSAASAAKEAFLVTRVGDILFLLGVFIYFTTYALAGSAGGWAANGFVFVQGNAPYLAGAMGGHSTLLTIAGLMILGGAAGKSAQFPLHVWLPDAMEGPTTVSALIHAATMVAAGVYLLAVASLFLGFTPTDQLAIVGIGGFTAFFAATEALVQTDIKRVVAYSTISQLGYMVLGVGAGFAMVGMFQLFTHAFFKALLFLAAGAVIHAVGSQDLFKMGGLYRPMRITAVAFLIGGLSLAGVPPFAGFFSKDDILSSVYSQLGAHPLYWPFFLLALATVFLTGYYIFRAWFLAFGGPAPRDSTLPHAHDPSWVMLTPLVVLSGLAIVAGFFPFVPAFAHLLPGANIPPTFSITDIALSVLSSLLAVSGIVTAYLMWGNGRVFALAADSPLRSVRAVVVERYYFKAAYDAIGLRVIYTLSRAADFVDRYVIDGAVHGVERAFSGLSGRARRMQSGAVLDYASFVVAGLAVLLALMLVIGPWIVSAWGG
jgi:NADH-quinone oxidoreductase subunit L